MLFQTRDGVAGMSICSNARRFRFAIETALLASIRIFLAEIRLGVARENALKRGRGLLPNAASNPQLFVDRQTVLPAVAHVVVDEPEHVQRVAHLSLLVEEFERAVQPEERLHALRVVHDQRMD
jgi:hypothetical protein